VNCYVLSSLFLYSQPSYFPLPRHRFFSTLDFLLCLLPINVDLFAHDKLPNGYFSPFIFLSWHLTQLPSADPDSFVTAGLEHCPTHASSKENLPRILIPFMTRQLQWNPTRSGSINERSISRGNGGVLCLREVVLNSWNIFKWPTYSHKSICKIYPWVTQFLSGWFGYACYSLNVWRSRNYMVLCELNSYEVFS
jgi:hypothetical protein